jgi:hypothetical protein
MRLPHGCALESLLLRGIQALNIAGKNKPGTFLDISIHLRRRSASICDVRHIGVDDPTPNLSRVVVAEVQADES